MGTNLSYPQQNKEAVLVREIAVADAEPVVELSAELGYPVEIEVMRERISGIGASSGWIVYVASLAGRVIGWIDVAVIQHLATGAYGEIGGFVVFNGYRSRGVGRELIARAERWAAEQGAPKMVVRSRVTREATHRFYLREGYAVTKTSSVFSKQLTEEERVHESSSSSS